MKWTEEQIDILKSYYKNIDGKKINNVLIQVSKLTGKSVPAVRNKAYFLGITHREKYYTDEEILFLKNNINSMSFEDMGVVLNKNASNIKRKCNEIFLYKTKNCESKLINKKPRYKFTKEDRQKAYNKNSEKAKLGLHPKGNYGHNHSIETRKKLSAASLKGWKQMTPNKLAERYEKMIQTKIKNDTMNPNKNSSNAYSRAKGGKRIDLNNQYFRSSWEANIARYYNYIGVKWEYEPKTFYFENIRRGCISYTPDFYLTEEDKWIEVKGWMDDKSKTKLKRFKRYYPEEYKKLTIIQEKEYKEIKRKISPFIKNWE